MQNLWLVLAGVSGPVNWVASDRNIDKIIYITKPAYMLALIAWLWSTGDIKGPLVAFFVGALFCLAGDILLMLPERWFIFGLVAFLIGQIGYIAGFHPTLASFWPVGVPLAAALAVIGIAIFRPLAAGVRAKGMPQLVPPLFIYMVVILVMALSALLTLSNLAWRRGPAMLVSLGAMAFLVSDSLLAWSKFVKPFQHHRFIEMAIYHLAQLGILLGAGLNYI